MPSVIPGIGVLSKQNFGILHGVRVGLVTNQTGILPDGKTSTIDALFRADGVKLAALFGPEHGVRGNVAAGKYIATDRDDRTRLPVYSLYGKTRTPTAAMLKGVDVLVFDIQDIGCRSYTYLSTLGSVLEGASRHRIPVIVCDRPNPLGGIRIEGRTVAPGFSTFISKYPIAYRHGLTFGEAAKLLTGQGFVHKSDLQVIPCENLTRSLVGWESFGGLPWVATSPNVPTAESAILYAVTGIIGELSAVSIGIGTDAPFGYCGSPDLSANRFLDLLNGYALRGINFATARWIPRKGAYAGKSCAGVKIKVTDLTTAELCRVNFALLSALRIADPTARPFAKPGLFDAACGTDVIRRAFLRGASESDLWAEFQKGTEEFRKMRQPYLIY